MENVNEIVKNIVKNGGNDVKNALVTGVSVKLADGTNQIKYWVSITLDRPVKRMVDDGTGNFKEGMGNTIVVSNITMNAVLARTQFGKYKRMIDADAENAAIARGRKQDYISYLEDILHGGTISCVQQPVKEGVEVTNPFSLNGSTSTPNHDTFYDYLYDIAQFGYDADDARAELRANSSARRSATIDAGSAQSAFEAAMKKVAGGATLNPAANL